MKQSREILALLNAIHDELVAIDGDLTQTLESMDPQVQSEMIRALSLVSGTLTAEAFKSIIAGLQDDAEDEPHAADEPDPDSGT